MKKFAPLVAGVLAALGLSVAIAQPTLVPAPAAKSAEVATAPVTTATAAAPQLTATDVDAWLDGFMPYAIARGDIPGAVVVVVKDGQVLAEKGYGYANVAKKIKVDPKTTLFRPGSISKLFTWTALMQQVEQGKVDLNADVNRYIDFKIPPREGKPVTVLNLMTHTPGFEEAVKDLITLGPKEVPFETLLKRGAPARIYAPGTTPAYSNYGASLAGYIVQRTSGEPFDAYLERHIFGPLGMAHSTFRQPLPANLAPLMSEGYVPGKDEPKGFEFVNASPAGALSATGDDMARFMIAHLQNGQFNGQQILKPETAQLMHARANSPFAAGDGMAHGFYETNINGMRVIAHGGDTEAFHSDLHLFLDKNVGIYVSLNSAGKEGAAQPLRDTLFADFADRYFPEPANAVKVDPANVRADAEKLVGTYSTTRAGRTNFLSALDLLGQTKVTLDKDGNPEITDAKNLGGQPRKWIHVGPMTWRDSEGHDLLTANVAGGKATRFSFGELAPIIDFDRTPTYRSSAWILPLLYFSLAILLITALLWPTRALVRRKYKAEFGLEKRELWAYRSTRIASIAIVALLVGWLVAAQTMLGDLANQASFNTLLLPLELLSIIIFIGGFAVMLWYAYTAWRNGWRWPGKLWSTLLVIAAGMVLYIALVFKLISLTTSY
ncbi:serine hydrolase domain-containing protein [Sphingomonas sp. URHD0057]|uniref:serine hydrolase domain-containing protein n=1 Tax=Sphingomonas sp. URHD0057 TaxID=1380389 RepID=UPI00048C416F|nr:serine hydrolase domain-containing protein [Sphingomonas sp. URHD0057]